MLKFSYYGLESFKTWRDNRIVGEGIPLDNWGMKEYLKASFPVWICWNVMELNLDGR